MQRIIVTMIVIVLGITGPLLAQQTTETSTADSSTPRARQFLA